MAELKTQKTEVNPLEFLNGIDNEGIRKDALAIAKILEEEVKAEPTMWGAAIVGFGQYHYKYESGREMDWFPIGFSPRKSNISLYFAGGLAEYTDILARIGKHKTGKGCLYVQKLSDIDISVLRELVQVVLEKVKE